MTYSFGAEKLSMSPLLTVLWFALFVALGIYCPLVTRKSLRTGVAPYANFSKVERMSDPFQFWQSVIGLILVSIVSWICIFFGALSLIPNQ